METPEQAGTLFTLPDNRVLCYGVYGDSNADATVFFHHGLPGSLVEALGYDEPAKRHGIRVVAIERPGLGRSTHDPNRQLIDWPADLLAIADHLKIDRFAVLGVSGGGPYTIACLHQIPRTRCVGGGVVASMYPMKLGIDGMMLQNRIMLSLVPWSPWLVEKGFEYLFGSAARDEEHPEKLEKVFDDSFQNKPGPDRECIYHDGGRTRSMLIEDMRQALRYGSKGSAWEAKIAASDWGFRLEDVKVDPGQFVIWHGRLDVNAPVRMAEKAAQLIQGAEARISETDGHVSMTVGKLDEAMEAMKAILSR
ncbi:unnamed protein product [Clonostachys solani]|uniref:AB hydrolase-1 domain-containing protein n=1 Tax=Clonostachys solani TaxID=160281 RepID=A0A9P0EGD0_9HYPO|nr:unnamed protein product [Clonostachys solani]